MPVTVRHPRLEVGAFEAIVADRGSDAPMELIDGEVVVTPPLDGAASAVQGRVFAQLAAWQTRQDDRGLLLQDVFVRFTDRSTLAPDVSWWSADRRPSPIPAGAVDVIPGLVVEISSDATREDDLGPSSRPARRHGTSTRCGASTRAIVPSRSRSAPQHRR